MEYLVSNSGATGNNYLHWSKQRGLTVASRVSTPPIPHWPLFKARDVMRGVIESAKVDCAP